MPQQGEQHPQFPECWWSNQLSTYACADGSTVDGNPLPADWDWASFGPLGMGTLGEVTINIGNDPETKDLQQRARQGDRAALEQLARSGNFTAKLATSLNMSLGSAEAVMIGGVALLAIVAVGLATSK